MTPEFWLRLCNFRSENVFNPWVDQDPLDLPGDGASDRRIRLNRHFQVDAKYLLIGEAPGYRGCHFSGIPFTCEKQIYEGSVPRASPPNEALSGCAVRAQQQLDRRRITSRALPWSEGSATVIWSTLHELGIANDVVLWNAFAFHPHDCGDVYTNRAPTRDELICGMDILAMVVESFTGATRIAVGKTAATTLKNLNFRIDHEVRHPSMGGANLFRSQMRALVA